MILIICAAYSFLGNSSLLGPSVYIGIYSESFGISPATASGLISYPNLAYGFGVLFGGIALPPGLAILTWSRFLAVSSSLPQIRSSACHVALHHFRESGSALSKYCFHF